MQASVYASQNQSTEKSLSPKFKKHLKALGHHLKPYVYVGQKGVTPSLIKQVQLDIAHHELMKIKIAGEDREERTSIATEILSSTGCTLVQNLGHTFLVYKESDDATIRRSYKKN